MCNVWVCVIVVFLLSCHRLVVHRCYQRELRKDEKKKRKAEMWDNNNSNNDNKPKMQQLVLYCGYEDNKQRGRKREGEKRQERKRKKRKKKTAWLNITETRGIQQPTAITVIVIRAYHSRHLLLVNKAKRTENA